MNIASTVPTFLRAFSALADALESRWARRSLIALGLVIFALGVHRARLYFHDDAYISLRYVARFLAGKGLTWNDGERVEGFTHPLWIFQLSALGAVHVPLVTAARALGIVYTIALFVVLSRSTIPGWGLLIVATHPATILWSVSGLETTSFVFFLVCAALLMVRAREAASRHEYVRERRSVLLAATAFSLAALTRPEGILAGAVGLAAMMVGRTATRRTLVAAVAIFVVPGLAYELFRLVYYGDLLPNAVRAKTEGIPLAIRLSLSRAYLATNASAWVPALTLTIMAFGRARSHDARILAAIALSLVPPIIAGGGDHMPGGRFLLPIVALGTIAAGLLASNSDRGTRLVLAIAALLVAGEQTRANWEEVPYRRDDAASKGLPVGRFLQMHLPPGSVVALATAGSTPFAASDLKFIDTLGLNDRVIARRRIDAITTRMQQLPGHLKGDGAYVLSRKPDVIILAGAEGWVGDPPTSNWFFGDEELLSSPEFRAKYRPWLFQFPLLPSETGHFQRNFASVTAFLRVDSERTEELRRFAKAELSARWSPSLP